MTYKIPVLVTLPDCPLELVLTVDKADGPIAIKLSQDTSNVEITVSAELKELAGEYPYSI